jgi:hypothetical protein
MMTDFSPKIAKIFICKNCDYECFKESDFKKHNSTRKHQNSYAQLQKVAKKSPKIAKQYVCECGKEYMYRQGLHLHKKRCDAARDSEPNEPDDLGSDFEINEKQMVLMLLKENKELKTMMMDQQSMVLELCKNGTGNTNNSHNTTNSHNKSFNLQFFLNETCKDAMNITEFVDSIQLQLSDLEKVGELGYVKGISNIIVKNLNALDITKRPVHCADRKREVLYIKSDDKWEREEDDNKNLRKMIKRVAFKNYKQLPQFKAKHPDCNTSESKYSDDYNKIIIESMGGAGDNEKENEDKIIRNISKEVVIEKGSL